MANIVNNYASTVITILKDVITNYERNLTIIKQTEEELNDINHEIELSEAKDMYKGYLMYKEIRELRRKRRQAKDENEVLQELYEYAISQNGQGVKAAFQKMQGHSVKIRETQESRIYIPRRRTDLTIANQTCTAYKPFEEMLADFNKTTFTKKGGKLRKS